LAHIAHDFQVDKYYPERNFFLAILKDADTGYLYEDVIIREKLEME
jgi:hypothetical protein